ncbi:MAG: hypothetical protein RQ732_07605 [Methylophaga sp.]|nr:hypothetical protein [Methylophaga sp.]
MKSTLFSAAFLLTCLTVNTTATAASYHTTLYYQPDGTYKEGADAGNLLGQVINTDASTYIGVTYKLLGGDYWRSSSSGIQVRPRTADGYDGFVGFSSLSFSYQGQYAYGCGSGGKYPVQGLSALCMWGDSPGLDAGPEGGIITFDEVSFGYSMMNGGFPTEFSLESVSAGLSATHVSAVPIPAAAFMFAPALLGLMGLRRKAKNLVA